MKSFKFIFSVILLVFGFNMFSTVASAEEGNDVEILTFEELSDEDKQVFLEEGFTEEDTFFKEDIALSDTSSEGFAPASNLIATVVGSTRREMSYRAKSTYTVTSFTSVMRHISIRTTASGGGIIRNATTTSSPNARRAVMSTTILYHGPANYFNFRGNTQITTSSGVAGTVFSIASGGTTLGF